MKVVFVLGALVATFHNVNSHNGVANYTIDGIEYRGAENVTYTNGYRYPDEYTIPYNASIQRQWATINPLWLSNDSFMACNNPGTPTETSLVAPVRAGGTVKVSWGWYWPHPWGPALTYMADCHGPCSEANATDLDWFKIHEMGLLNGTWAGGIWGAAFYWTDTGFSSDDGGLLANSTMLGGPPAIQIPQFLKPGNYLIRHELIILYTDVQFFMECASLEVTGSGTKTPDASYLVKFPGAYHDDDPGIVNPHDAYWFFTLNRNRTDYTIPGPKVWTSLE